MKDKSKKKLAKVLAGVTIYSSLPLGAFASNGFSITTTPIQG